MSLQFAWNDNLCDLQLLTRQENAWSDWVGSAKKQGHIVLKSVTCQTNKQEILHTGVGFHKPDSKKMRQKCQLVYINQVISADKTVSGRVLKYSSYFWIWKINQKSSAM